MCYLCYNIFIMRRGTFVAGLATSVALMAGCSESVPDPIAPNGTLEQVTHNLGYGDALGKLTLRQEVNLTTPSGEAVNVYNFTDTPLDKGEFTNMVAFYLEVGKTGTLRTVTLYPRGTDEPVVTSSFEFERKAKEHAFVLVPDETGMPPRLGGKSGPEAATAYFPEQSQTISVIEQQIGPGKTPVPFEESNGLPIEACQAFVYESATFEGDQLSLGDRLAQETMCNSFGDAWDQAHDGVLYDEYVRKNSDSIGLIGAATGNYAIGAYIFTPEEYGAIAAA
jgi:hypothetical protein